VLRDVNGERFMQAIHPMAELAPRDVVARGIAAQMAKQDAQPVLLDATALGAEFLHSRFPTIDAACHLHGLDWANKPIPVTLAAHYWMGGVHTDLYGRTSVPGLFAVGEVACTGVHGANRLASNSLLESLVFAWRCAHLLLADENAIDWAPAGSGEAVLPFDEAGAPSQPITREELRTLMWSNAGVVRSAAGLRQALSRLNRSYVTGEDVTALETRNLLALGRVVLTAALAREESRGAHFREDFPKTSVALQHSLTYAGTAVIAAVTETAIEGKPACTTS
jgi:L-aspartate oxidase